MIVNERKTDIEKRSMQHISCIHNEKRWFEMKILNAHKSIWI